MQEKDRESAISISNWRYDAPYDFYNMDSDNIKELINGSYSAIMDDSDSLVGFFCVGSSAQVPAGHEQGAYSEDGSEDGFVDVGLGMRPDLTGKGMEFELVFAILAKVEALFDGQL